jgi:hypothetical protein
MPSLSDLFDTYSRKARLYPGLLVVLPVLPYLLLQLPILPAADQRPGWFSLLWPVAVAAGLFFLLTNVVRSRGKAAQKHLLRDWDGFPTTQALRHRGSGSPQYREHRHQRLEKLLSVILPTAAEETQDPAAADGRYELAVDQLIARVRAQGENFPLVQEESAQYGFRRNLLGVRPYALVILAVCLAYDLALITGVLPGGTSSRSLTGVVLAVHAAALLGWLAQVRPPWVREAADDYTTRIFATLDDPRL